MLIGMVKDTSVFSVIGMARSHQGHENVESVTYQYFMLYTAGRRHLCCSPRS